MKFKSPVYSQVSGSIAGITYAHNRGGLYARARTIPVNPNSPGQVQVRSTFSGLVSRWINTLTVAQRLAWTIYAQNTPLTDKLGDPLILTGLQMYIRCNVVRGRGLLSKVDDGPTIFGQALLTPPTILAIVAPMGLSLTFDNTDAWAGSANGGLVVQVSTPQNATINFFKSPFRFAGTQAGNPVPPSSPFVVITPFVFTAGQKIFVRVRSSESDARLSAVQFLSAIVT